MITAAGFAGAAAVGAVIRWQVTIHLPRPAATLLVNLTGAFVLGLLDGWSAPELTIVGVGGLGAYTTFSTLADDIAQLWSPDRRLAVGYMAVTIVGGIGAAASGLAISG
jgi:CrcB protein